MDQEIDIPIVGGIDEKTDDRITARMLSIVNARYDRSGALSKRLGYTCVGPLNVYSNGDIPEAPYLLTSFGGELLRIGGGELASHRVSPDTVAPISDWVLRDRVPNCVPTRSGVASEIGIISNTECVVVGTVQFVTYLLIQPGSGGARYYVLLDITDLATGTRVLSKYPIEGSNSAIYRPKAVLIYGSLHIFWRTSSEVKFRTVEPTLFTIGTETVLVSGLWNREPYDVVAIGVGSASLTVGSFACIYESIANGFIVQWFNSVYTSLGFFPFGSLTVQGYSDFTAMAITASATQVVGVAANDVGANSEVYVSGYNLSVGNTVLTPWFDTTVESMALDGSKQWLCVAATSTTGGDTLVSWSYAGAGRTVGPMGWNEVNTAGAISHAFNRTLSDASIVSEPFTASNARTYQIVVSRSMGASTYFVLDLRAGETAVPQSMFLVASVATEQVPGEGAASVAGQSNVAVYGTGVYAGIVVSADATPGTANAESLLLEFGHVPMTVASDNRLLYIGGGCPFVYDRSETFEMGFCHEPTNLTLTAATGGSKDLLGVYSVRVIYERYDGAGNLYRSAPSDAVSVTLTGANRAIDVEVDNIQLTNFINETDEFLGHVAVVAYCTRNLGSAYYRDTEYVIPRENFLSNPVSFRMTDADSDISERQQLYSTGAAGEPLVNRMPPAARFPMMFRGSLLLAGTDDDYIWISKPIIPGEGPGFNGDLALPPIEGGRITALSQMDDLVIAFKEDAIYATSGELPNELGEGGTLGALWTRIPSLVGCTDHRSVCETPLGITFKSRDGLYLLARDRTVVPLSKDISASTDASFCAASFIPQSTTVRFAEYDTSSLWNLDLYHSQPGAWVWTQDQVANVEMDEGALVFAACTHNGSYYWIDETGHLYKEQAGPDTRSDGTTSWITVSIESSWVKLSGLQGYTRCRKIGVLLKYAPSASVTVEVGLDYNPTYTQSRSWTDIALDASNVGGMVTVQMMPHPQKTQAFRVRVTDSVPTPAVPAATFGTVGLTGLRATVDIMPGQRRIRGSVRG